MIHYVAYYSTKESGRVKNYAGEDKIDYICRVLNDLGEEVVIVSNAKTTGQKFAKRSLQHLFGVTSVLYFSSLPKGNKLLHAIDVLWGYIQLFFYVLFCVKRNETILVYHSLGYRGIWKVLKRIKQFNYVLEVEELFQKIDANTSGYKKHEKKVFRYPDAFICSNSILAEEVNRNHKPVAIINGIYSNNKITLLDKENHEIVKVVYAGSLEKQKGVDYIIKAAEYLPESYETCIIGFGTEQDYKRIKELINISTGNVKYYGVLKVKEYQDYIQQCDIGVCIQDETDEFNHYEYPSKIFSYLANGLQVVVNDLMQLRKSEVFPFLHIAESKDPEDIAKAITSCENKFFDAEAILNQLNEGFKRDIKDVLYGGK